MLKMIKYYKTVPYWVYILSSSIGIQLYYIIAILYKTKISRVFVLEYLSWIKNEGAEMEIINILLFSIFYLIVWYFDKQYTKKDQNA